MKEKFLKLSLENHFFDQHKKVLIAVSAGKDSMALLDCLILTRKQLQIEIGIAHINHHQRLESDDEEQYLKEFSKQNNLPIFIAHYQQPNFSEKKARDFRYDFFKKVMENEGYTALVTAHHADDQAETVFMRFIRGSRLLHLSGISPVQPFGTGELIRPLLGFKKSELQADVYFEDSSNQDSAYLRNRIRNQYLPILQQENPHFSDYLIEFGQETAQLFQAFQDLSKNIDPTNVAVFRQQSPSVQRFLLQVYLEQFPDLQLSKAQFNEMLHIIQTKANHHHLLKNNYLLHKDYDRFQVVKIIPKSDEKKAQCVVQSDGIFEYNSFIFSINQVLSDATHILWVEKKKPLILRNRKSGDTLQINGITKKVRRYFIDHKVSAEKRENAIIIEQDEKILGITNMVTSDLSKSLKNDIMVNTLYIKRKE